MRVLVADDHPFVRAGICRLINSDPTLSLCGEAADGLDAVQKAADTKPDLVLLDISMPHLDGFGAAREIKRLVPSCQIVIVSQHDSPPIREQAKEIGAIAYVAKSDISTQLLKTVAAIKKFGSENSPITAPPNPSSSPGTGTTRPESTLSVLKQPLGS